MNQYRNDYARERRACREYMDRRDRFPTLVWIEEALIEAIVWTVRHPLQALGVVAFSAFAWLGTSLWLLS